MISPAFPRTQGALSRESYLTLLLIALVDQAGGEIHLSAQSLDACESGGRLLIDWDTAAQQLVIRAGSPSLVVAEVRGTGWTTTQPAAAQPPSSAPPSSHRVMTEDQILKVIEERMRADAMRQWRQQGADAVASMPPPDDDTQTPR